MLRKFQLLMVLSAWLLATGSHWDLVQTFGWGRMIVTYSQSMPLAQAIKLTFTPDNMCGVCESVSAAKQQENTTVPNDGKVFAKIFLVIQPAQSFVMAIPANPRWVLSDKDAMEIDRYPPPVPPPRAVV